MKIKLYWPDCDYQNKRWDAQKIDSFWVECYLEEAENFVFQYLTPNQIEKSKKHWRLRPASDMGKYNIATACLCYLVSKSLASIEPFPWFYPYSGQWGDGCPFISIEEMVIGELTELEELVVHEIDVRELRGE
ncbi:MAG: hypothetical protein EOM59_00895 [Clostridia bacterium]|nr:hypothetical protein [Clostridia bacterium]